MAVNNNEILSASGAETTVSNEQVELEVPNLEMDTSNLEPTPIIKEQDPVSTTTPTLTSEKSTENVDNTPSAKLENIQGLMKIQDKQVAPYYANALSNPARSIIRDFETNTRVFLPEDTEELWKNPEIQKRFNGDKKIYDQAIAYESNKYKRDSIASDQRILSERIYNENKQAQKIDAGLNYANYYAYLTREQNRPLSLSEATDRSLEGTTAKMAYTKKSVDGGAFLRSGMYNLWENPKSLLDDYSIQEVANIVVQDKETGEFKVNGNVSVFDTFMNPKTVGFTFNQDGKYDYDTDDDGNLYIRDLKDNEKHGTIGVNVLSIWGPNTKFEDTSNIPLWIMKTMAKGVLNSTLQGMEGIVAIGDASLNMMNPDWEVLEGVRNSLFASQFQKSEFIQENPWNGYSLVTHITDGLSQLMLGAGIGMGATKLASIAGLGGTIAGQSANIGQQYGRFVGSPLAKALIGETFGAAASRLTLTTMWASGIMDAAENAGMSKREAATVLFATLGAGQIIGLLSDKALGFINTKAGFNALQEHIKKVTQTAITSKAVAGMTGEKIGASIAQKTAEGFNKFVSSNITKAAIGEAIEEGIAELAWEYGIVKLAQSMQALNIDPFEKLKKDVWFDENYNLKAMGEQSLQGAFIGGITGGIGGAINQSRNAFDGSVKEDVEMSYLIITGQVDRINKEAEAMHRKALFGSKRVLVNKLTGETEIAKPGMNMDNYITLNDVMYQVFKNKVDNMQALIKASGIEEVVKKYTQGLNEVDALHKTKFLLNTYFSDKTSKYKNDFVMFNVHTDLTKYLQKYSKEVYSVEKKLDGGSPLTETQKADLKASKEQLKLELQSIMSGARAREYSQMALVYKAIDMDEFAKTGTVKRRFTKLSDLTDFNHYNNNILQAFENRRSGQNKKIAEEQLSVVKAKEDFDSLLGQLEQLHSDYFSEEGFNPDIANSDAIKHVLSQLYLLKSKYGDLITNSNFNAIQEPSKDKNGNDILRTKFDVKFSDGTTKSYQEDENLSGFFSQQTTDAFVPTTQVKDIDMLQEIYFMDFDVKTKKQVVGDSKGKKRSIIKNIEMQISDTTIEDKVKRLVAAYNTGQEVDIKDAEIIIEKIKFLKDLVDYNAIASKYMYGYETSFPDLKESEKQLQKETGVQVDAIQASQQNDNAVKVAKENRKETVKYDTLRNVGIPSTDFVNGQINVNGLTEDERKLFMAKLNAEDKKIKALYSTLRANTKTIEGKEIDVYRKMFFAHNSILNHLVNELSIDDLTKEEKELHASFKATFEKQIDQQSTYLSDLENILSDENDSELKKEYLLKLTSPETKKKFDDAILKAKKENSLTFDEETEKARLKNRFTEQFIYQKYQTFYSLKSDLETEIFTFFNNSDKSEFAYKLFDKISDNGFKINAYKIGYDKNIRENIQEHLSDSRYIKTYFESIISFQKNVFNNYAKEYTMNINDFASNLNKSLTIPSYEQLEIAFQAVASLNNGNEKIKQSYYHYDDKKKIASAEKDGKTLQNNIEDLFANTVTTSALAGGGKTQVLIPLVSYIHEEINISKDNSKNDNSHISQLYLKLFPNNQEMDFFEIENPDKSLTNAIPISKANKKGYFMFRSDYDFDIMERVLADEDSQLVNFNLGKDSKGQQLTKKTFRKDVKYYLNKVKDKKGNTTYEIKETTNTSKKIVTQSKPYSPFVLMPSKEIVESAKANYVQGGIIKENILDYSEIFNLEFEEFKKRAIEIGKKMKDNSTDLLIIDEIQKIELHNRNDGDENKSLVTLYKYIEQGLNNGAKKDEPYKRLKIYGTGDVMQAGSDLKHALSPDVTIRQTQSLSISFRDKMGSTGNMTNAITTESLNQFGRSVLYGLNPPAEDGIFGKNMVFSGTVLKDINGNYSGSYYAEKFGNTELETKMIESIKNSNYAVIVLDGENTSITNQYVKNAQGLFGSAQIYNIKDADVTGSNIVAGKEFENIIVYSESPINYNTKDTALLNKLNSLYTAITRTEGSIMMYVPGLQYGKNIVTPMTKNNSFNKNKYKSSVAKTSGFLDSLSSITFDVNQQVNNEGIVEENNIRQVVENSLTEINNVVSKDGYEFVLDKIQPDGDEHKLKIIINSLLTPEEIVSKVSQVNPDDFQINNSSAIFDKIKDLMSKKDATIEEFNLTLKC